MVARSFCLVDIGITPATYSASSGVICFVGWGAILLVRVVFAAGLLAAHERSPRRSSPACAKISSHPSSS